MTLPSLSPYSNKAFISGAHRWEIKYTYLQDMCCIVKTWIQRNKSISRIKMCMCGEWMVYGDDGDNNGGSLILLLLFEGIHTFLAFWNFMRRVRCSSFFSFLSGGYLVPLILLSDTCPFLPLVSLFLFFEVPGTCPFLHYKKSANLWRILDDGFKERHRWYATTSGTHSSIVDIQPKTQYLLAYISCP